MAKDYSYKDAMEAALEAGMMGVPGGMAAGAARGIKGAARGMADAMGRGIEGARDRFPEDMEELQPPGMMERMMGTEAGKAARAYGRAYKEGLGMKKGGKVKGYKAGGSVSSASKRADGCAVRGKTKGRMI